MISAIRNNPILSMPFSIGSAGFKTLALTGVALKALSSIPSAMAGPQLYFACIQTCAGNNVDMVKAFVCPTICLPTLLAPGA